MSSSVFLAASISRYRVGKKRTNTQTNASENPLPPRLPPVLVNRNVANGNRSHCERQQDGSSATINTIVNVNDWPVATEKQNIQQHAHEYGGRKSRLYFTHCLTIDPTRRVDAL